MAYHLLHNEEYPGWLYEVNLGATTIWERWNSLSPDGSVSSTGMNSFNHYAYGAIGEWMWRTMAGINPCEEQPGFKRVVLRPVSDAAVKHVTAAYHSPAGCYRVSWRMEEAGICRFHIEIPFDCTADLMLPGQFQSTLPARGATRKTLEAEIPGIFQSTLPARGATSKPARSGGIGSSFQSTLPARGATRDTARGWEKKH